MYKYYYTLRYTMDAFIRTFSMLTDSQLENLYTDLREKLAELAGELMENGMSNESNEQLDRAKQMDQIGLQLKAVTAIVKARRSRN
jgi:hypothetical protein